MVFIPSLAGFSVACRKNCHVLSVGVPLGGPVSHRVHRSISTSVGGTCSLQVAGGAHVSAHKTVGSAHRMEGDSTFCPAAVGLSHFDSQRQQNSSSSHKLPRGVS